MLTKHFPKLCSGNKYQDFHELVRKGWINFPNMPRLLYLIKDQWPTISRCGLWGSPVCLCIPDKMVSCALHFGQWWLSVLWVSSKVIRVEWGPRQKSADSHDCTAISPPKQRRVVAHLRHAALWCPGVGALPWQDLTRMRSEKVRYRELHLRGKRVVPLSQAIVLEGKSSSEPMTFVSTVCWPTRRRLVDTR